MKLSELLTPSQDSDPELDDLDKLIGKTSEQINKLQELVNQSSKLHSLEDQTSLLQAVKNTSSNLLLFQTAPCKKQLPTAADKAGQKHLDTLSAEKVKADAISVIKCEEIETSESSSLPDVLSSCSLSSNSSCSSYKSCEADVNEVPEEMNNKGPNTGASATTVHKKKENLSTASDNSSSTATNTRPSSETTEESSSNSSNVAGAEYMAAAATSWQQLLSLPPQQHLVVERMYSGARRFVVLDFGEPILLTDIIVPMSTDLVSLSVDVWLTGEELDATRLSVCPDIGIRPLVLTDLQPPPLCRFIKLTSLGRYGMITAESNISLGNFYGHRLLLPLIARAPNSPAHNKHKPPNKQQAQAQLQIASSIVEAVGCRYSLASNNLRALLQLYTQHNGARSSNVPDNRNFPAVQAEQQLHADIKAGYHECMLEQHHLNVITSMLHRLQRLLGVMKDSTCLLEFGAGGYNPATLLQQSSCDKLQTIHQYAINTMLTLTLHPTHGSIQTLSPVLLTYCGSESARNLFKCVLQRGTVSAQVCFAFMLLRTCVTESWWGEFLATTITDIFAANNASVLHVSAIRVFGLLAFLGQKSICSGQGGNVINAVLNAISTRLLYSNSKTSAPSSTTSSSAASNDSTNECSTARYDAMFARLLPSSNNSSPADVELLEWMLLFLSHCLDALSYVKLAAEANDKTKETGIVYHCAVSCLNVVHLCLR